jgi:hypothetical protein
MEWRKFIRTDAIFMLENFSIEIIWLQIQKISVQKTYSNSYSWI